MVSENEQMADQFLSHSLSFFKILLVELATKSRVYLHHHRSVVLHTTQCKWWQMAYQLQTELQIIHLPVQIELNNS